MKANIGRVFYLVFFLCITIVTAQFCHPHSCRNGITTAAYGGRLGDQLFLYLRAQWIARISGLPFFYRPFEYSSELALHTMNPHLGSHEFQTRVVLAGRKWSRDRSRAPDIKKLQSLGRTTTKKSTLYIVEFCRNGYDYQSDQRFLDLMRKHIAPCKPIILIEPPQDIVSIAIHIRTGGGYKIDTEKTQHALPTKFPPLPFYARALDAMMAAIPAQPLFIYVFTDHPSPQHIVGKIQKEFDLIQQQKSVLETHKHPMRWEYRIYDNAHDKNVLEDFFSFFNFDCLIRPWANLSRVAEILGDHALAIGLGPDPQDLTNFKIKAYENRKRFKKLFANSTHDIRK